jgi:hypothetical protein
MAQNPEDIYGSSRSKPFGTPSTDIYTGTTGQRPESGEGGVLDSAKQMASGLMSQVKEQATTQAQEKKQTVIGGLQSVGNAFRQMSDGLTQQDNGPVAKYAAELGRAVGTQTDNLSRYMEGRDISEIADDLHDFARRQPTVFLGGALLLGLAVSRFLKSSRPTQSTRYDARNSEGWRPDRVRQRYAGTAPSWDVPSPSTIGLGPEDVSNATGISDIGSTHSFPAKTGQAGLYDSGDRTSDEGKLEP